MPTDINLIVAAPRSSPGATMKLGSSRGMDTKRPRGSERSKPCHESQLTRRSQPPYPWPPEQAQPGVSKPCRTTAQPKSCSFAMRKNPFRTAHPDGSPDPESLSEIGWKRARKLVDFFSQPSAKHVERPDVVFAAAPEVGSKRPAQTVTPLVEALWNEPDRTRVFSECYGFEVVSASTQSEADPRRLEFIHRLRRVPHALQSTC